MANLQRLLGTMLASGLGGRSRRGPAFSVGGTRVAFGRRRRHSKTAGLASLAQLAYQAYQDHQAKQPPAGRTAEGGGAPAPSQSSPSLGDRLAGLFSSSEREEPAPPADFEDERALLLIRAMVAAANADGEITPEERRRILAKMDEAEAGPEEHQVLERELAQPRSIEDLASAIHDEETAEQVYLASRVAMNPDTPAEEAYLKHLASRLDLSPEQTRELDSAA